MRMIHAVEVMSRNRNGEFQWKDQLVSILNILGDLSVDEDSTVDELLAAVERLDNDSKNTLFAIKVSFSSEFIDIMKEEEKTLKKESQKFFYGFIVVVFVVTLALVWTGDNHGIEPETLRKFMDFGLGILKLLTGSGD